MSCNNFTSPLFSSRESQRHWIFSVGLTRAKPAELLRVKWSKNCRTVHLCPILMKWLNIAFSLNVSRAAMNVLHSQTNCWDPRLSLSVCNSTILCGCTKEMREGLKIFCVLKCFTIALYGCHMVKAFNCWWVYHLLFWIGLFNKIHLNKL